MQFLRIITIYLENQFKSAAIRAKFSLIRAKYAMIRAKSRPIRADAGFLGFYCLKLSRCP